MDNRKVLGGIILTFLLVLSFNPLIDEINAIAIAEDAMTFDLILGRWFPPIYAVMILCVLATTIYWVFKS